MLGGVELGWKFHGARGCFLLKLRLTGQVSALLLLDGVLRHGEMVVFENAAALQGQFIDLHLVDDRHWQGRGC